MVRQIGLAAALVWTIAAGTALAQNTTTRVSVATNGAQGTASHHAPAVSADGRYVAFGSRAPNLVPDDTNGRADIFVHDRLTQTTERISFGPKGLQGNFDSNHASISADGRLVAFSSAATTLVPGDSNGKQDVFVHDRQTGTTTRVSMSTWGLQLPGGNQTDGDSSGPVISADGRYVAYQSSATNLVPDDSNDFLDIFRVDLRTNATVRVSESTGGAPGNDASLQPAISADGRIVVFYSHASNLIPGDANGESDVFVRNIQTGTTTRVSISSAGVEANRSNHTPSVTGDGRFVTFHSQASNLDPTGGYGLFIHDRQTNVTSPLALVSGSSDPLLAPNDAKISGNARFVCFSLISTLTSVADLWLIDRQTETKSRVSVATNGDVGDGQSSNCDVNPDGTVVVFASSAKNLVAGDTNGFADIFVRMLPGNANNSATMTLDRGALTFGAVSNGATLVAQTAAQRVRLTQSGTGIVTWSAASSQPWLQVSPASGTGSATISIGVASASGLPASGTVTGTVFISLTNAANTLPPIEVSLTLVPNGRSLNPFGTVDTPADNRTGVTGAVPFTGWALDDVEVTRVSICRTAFGQEVAPIDPNCGGGAEIFIGFAVFIDGARPDVAAAFPSHPLFTRGGWGFMLLTNFLPNQGNGTFQFTMRAQDREGHSVVLGTRTMTCANASATLPFGTLDTPEQGGPAFGSAFPSFGWALTPLPKTIPTNGSTIHVLVDGVDAGTASYNHARSDIQALFPGFNNTNGAVGFRILDTTAMTNGLHTISWTVTDDGGATEGIGSRFFTVSNGTGAVTAALASARLRDDVDGLPLETTLLVGRRGWDLEAPHGVFAAGASGVTVIRSEEVNRVELQLGAGDYAGHLRTSAGLAPLPIGSHLDRATNTFTWAPGVGFVGRYDFVFVRSVNERAVSRRDVRIVLHPKGRGAIGPQVVIDLPHANAAVNQPFLIGGWAVDLDATHGTGVTTLHGWAFPARGGAPIFLGATAYGGARPDVAAIHGARFKGSGFGLIVQELPAGDYDLALFAWSTETMGFVAPTIVRVRVTP